MQAGHITDGRCKQNAFRGYGQCQEDTFWTMPVGHYEWTGVVSTTHYRRTDRRCKHNTLRTDDVSRSHYGRTNYASRTHYGQYSKQGPLRTQTMPAGHITGGRTRPITVTYNVSRTNNGRTDNANRTHYGRTDKTHYGHKQCQQVTLRTDRQWNQNAFRADCQQDITNGRTMWAGYITDGQLAGQITDGRTTQAGHITGGRTIHITDTDNATLRTNGLNKQDILRTDGQWAQ